MKGALILPNAVVQGIGRQLWKWSASVADVMLRGEAATKSEAVAEAERTIDRKCAANRDPLCFENSMADKQNHFTQFDVERGIALRWALRDIKARRLKYSPVGDADIQTLTELGLVEVREDGPVLTQAGHDALD
jgi:hypothetical protein